MPFFPELLGGRDPIIFFFWVVSRASKPGLMVYFLISIWVVQTRVHRIKDAVLQISQNIWDAVDWDFGHKIKLLSVFLPWRQENIFTFFLVGNDSCLSFTFSFFFFFSPKAVTRSQQNATSWLLSHFFAIGQL